MLLPSIHSINDSGAAVGRNGRLCGVCHPRPCPIALLCWLLTAGEATGGDGGRMMTTTVWRISSIPNVPILLPYPSYSYSPHCRRQRWTSKVVCVCVCGWACWRTDGWESINPPRPIVRLSSCSVFAWMCSWVGVCAGVESEREMKHKLKYSHPTHIFYS